MQVKGYLGEKRRKFFGNFGKKKYSFGHFLFPPIVSLFGHIIPIGISWCLVDGPVQKVPDFLNKWAELQR